jgi:DHA2 family multidrug resistance protein
MSTATAPVSANLSANPVAITPAVNPWPIALAVMLPTFLEVLDTTIANVSLSHIAGNLSVSNDESTWVLTSYLVANAIIIPCSGWLGQRFGRKRFLLACVAVFTFASMMCGLATSLPMLLLMRVVQGAGGGAFQPIAQAIMMESFPAQKRGMAMGVFGLGVVIAPVLGPVIGGWITDNYNWRWIFLFKVPLGVLAVFLIQRFVHDPPWFREHKPGRLDMFGMAFLSLWLGCQEVLLDKGQEDDWFAASGIRLLGALAVVGLIAFVLRERAARHPFIDLSVLRNRQFTLGAGLMFFAGLSLYGMTALVPMFLQSLLGYTALQSGLTMIPRGLAAVVAMPIVGRLVNVIPGAYLAATGFAVYGISTWWLTGISANLGPAALLWPLVLSGVSIAFMFVPLNTIALGNIPREQMGSASGIINLMRNVGGSVGITVVTTLVARGAQTHQAMLVKHVSAYDPAMLGRLHAMSAHFAAQGDSVAGRMALAKLYHAVVAQADMLAYLDLFAVLTLGCVGCVALTFCMRKTVAAGPVSAH